MYIYIYLGKPPNIMFDKRVVRGNTYTPIRTQIITLDRQVHHNPRWTKVNLNLNRPDPFTCTSLSDLFDLPY